MKKKKVMIILSTVAVVLFLVAYTMSYSFTKPKTHAENQSQTIVASKKLRLYFDDSKELNVKGLFPGSVVTKTFQVRSTASSELTYNLKFERVENKFKTDLAYTLKLNGETIVEKVTLKDNLEEIYLYTNIKIEPEEEQNYELIIEFLDKDYDQYENENTFKGVLAIDQSIVKNEEVLVYTYNNGNDLTEETNNFTVANVNNTDKIEYNILLEKLNLDNDISYELTSDEEIISSGTISKEENAKYILTNQQLDARTVKEYSLNIYDDSTISYYIDGKKLTNTSNKKYGKLSISTKLDLTPPTCSFSNIPTSWVSQASLKFTGSDVDSALDDSPYSLDGKTFKTDNTITITTNGTYTGYVRDDKGNIGSCSTTTSYVDSSKATAPTVSGGSSYWLNSYPTFSASGSSVLSGVKNYEYFYTTSSSTPAYTQAASGTGSSFKLSAEGKYYVYFRAVSNTGVKGNWSSYKYVKIDTKNTTCDRLAFENVTSSGFDAVLYGMRSPKTISKIEFPTWTDANGQDDLVWHQATKVNSDTWKFHVYTSQHKNERGTYIVHVYYTLSDSTFKIVASGTVKVP